MSEHAIWNEIKIYDLRLLFWKFHHIFELNTPSSKQSSHKKRSRCLPIVKKGGKSQHSERKVAKETTTFTITRGTVHFLKQNSNKWRQIECRQPRGLQYCQVGREGYVSVDIRDRRAITMFIWAENKKRIKKKNLPLFCYIYSHTDQCFIVI